MEKQNNNPDWIIIPSEEARKMFGVSKRTWAIWRENRLLTYIKIGQLIFYKVNDIKEFINKHTIKNIAGNQWHLEGDANGESYIAHIAPNVELKVCKNGNIYRDGVLIKPFMNCGKLYYMYGKNPSERRSILVARLVADYFVPNPCMGRFIGYKDGNPLNINAENLFWKIGPR